MCDRAPAVSTSTGALDPWLARDSQLLMARPSRPLLRRAAACEYLRATWGIERATATLAKLAVHNAGPRFRRAGRVPLYAVEDLDDWARRLLGGPGPAARP
jgi:hypothetical protein